MISIFSTVECQNGVSRRPETYITDLAGILSNWDALCVINFESDFFEVLLKFNH